MIPMCSTFQSMSIRMENSTLGARKETGIIVVRGPAKEGEIICSGFEYAQHSLF